MKPDVDSEKKCSCKPIIIFLIGLLMLPILGLGFIRYRSWQEQKQAKIFLHQIIDSVLNQTEFYKNNSEKEAIEELNNNIGIITNLYDVIIVDYDFGTWDCLLLFDNDRAFRAGVAFENGKPLLVRLWLEPKAWTQKYLESVRKATTKDTNKSDKKE